MIAAITVPGLWYVAMVKSSAMKVYENAFGIQHMHTIIFELHVWQLIFLGAGILSST